MMRRFSLSQRLTLLFILLLMLCATVACTVQLYSSMQYGNAMVQRLSGGRRITSFYYLAGRRRRPAASEEGSG